MQEATVCHLFQKRNGNGGEILLGRRNKLFCNGIWNGAGGRSRSCETPLRCVCRETREEIAVRVERESTRHFATVDFYLPLPDGTYSFDWRVHYFRAHEWTGKPAIIDGFSELFWYPVHVLPYDHMMADQEFWMPAAFAALKRGERLVGVVHYGDRDMRTVAKISFHFVPI